MPPTAGARLGMARHGLIWAELTLGQMPLAAAKPITICLRIWRFTCGSARLDQCGIPYPRFRSEDGRYSLRQRQVVLRALQTAKSSWHTKGPTKAGLLFQLRHAGALWRALIQRAAAYRLPSIRHTILRLFRSACLLLNSVSNSVSQLSESKVATLQSGITYEVSGNVVIVNAYNITYSSNSRRFGPMPKGLRPRSTRYGIVNSGSNAGIVFVDASGNIDVWAGANGTYTGQVVYTV